MKKLLVLISLLLVVSLGACENAPNDSTELENRVNTLEIEIEDLGSKVDELENILVDLEVIEGLNGQKSYYIPQEETSLFNTTSVSASVLELQAGELDKDKAPSYVLDANGNYVPFASVINKLALKYYGNEININEAIIGFQIKIRLNIGTMSQNEFMARTIFLIEELSLYDFYIIGGSELYIQLTNSSYGYIKIPIQTMRSSFITLTPEVIYNGLYEIQLHQMTFGKTTVKSLYDDYVTNETFTGYVLDYN